MPEFLAGSLAALCITSISMSERLGRVFRGAGILLILVASLAQPMLGPFPGLAALLPALGAVLVLLAKPSQGGVLAIAPLVWVGALSYSLYLWHWPVLAFLRYLIGEEDLGPVATIVFLATTLLLSLFSFYCVENPFRRIRKLSLSTLGCVFLATGALVSPSALASINLRLSPPPLPIEQRRYADPAQICHGKIVGDCVRGSRSSDLDVLVLGDSHAAMLNHFFEELGQKFKFKATVITASSCVTIPGFNAGRLKKWAQEPSMRQISVVERILGQKSDIVIAAKWSWQTQHPGFLAALEQFLGENSDKSIFLLSQVPRFTANLLRARRLSALGSGVIVKVDAAYKDANESIRKLAAQHAKAHYVSLDNLKLFESAPFWRSQLLYFDEHHLNELGALIYAEGAAATFDSVVLSEIQ